MTCVSCCFFSVCNHLWTLGFVGLYMNNKYAFPSVTVTLKHLGTCLTSNMADIFINNKTWDEWSSGFPKGRWSCLFFSRLSTSWDESWPMWPEMERGNEFMRPSNQFNVTRSGLLTITSVHRSHRDKQNTPAQKQYSSSLMTAQQFSLSCHTAIALNISSCFSLCKLSRLCSAGSLFLQQSDWNLLISVHRNKEGTWVSFSLKDSTHSFTPWRGLPSRNTETHWWVQRVLSLTFRFTASIWIPQDQQRQREE